MAFSGPGLSVSGHQSYLHHSNNGWGSFGPVVPLQRDQEHIPPMTAHSEGTGISLGLGGLGVLLSPSARLPSLDW